MFHLQLQNIAKTPVILTNIGKRCVEVVILQTLWSILKILLPIGRIAFLYSNIDEYIKYPHGGDGYNISCFTPLYSPAILYHSIDYLWHDDVFWEIRTVGVISTGTTAIGPSKRCNEVLI